eukprot:TRINITY_DN14897_c0_g1_i2.p1 TRINITY_DN14897_c0_g1~~TRINITY_DN14897_c0_g1_i2.p1  ORF type:complete len:473 (-),score=104.09 TRINITY_DN14897_c0_g1_i2:45-1463(-)
MHFSADFGKIIGGCVKCYGPGGSSGKTMRFGVNLHYSRLRLGMEDSASAVKNVLLQSGVPACEVDAAMQSDQVAAVRSTKVKPAEAARASMLQRRRLRSAVKLATASETVAEVQKLVAVTSLQKLASPPGALHEAEDALHQVLSNSTVTESVRRSAEEALVAGWEDSGNPKVNAELERGLTLLGKQQIEEAVVVLTRVTEMAPRFAEGWYKRSIALFAKGDISSALQDCKRVLELKPRHFACLTCLGLCHMELGEKAEAMRCWQAALHICPRLPAAEMALSKAEIDSIMDTYLKPRIERVVAALEGGTLISPDNLGTSFWDVHRIKNGDTYDSNARVYFFRVSIRKPAGTSGVVQSRARFYVLKGSDGKVFSFARPTQDEAGFELESGGEYRFCWSLVVGRDLQCAVAGTLLEDISISSESRQNASSSKFITEDLPVLLPEAAPEVAFFDVASLGKGYTYTGQLDLRQAAGF